jgi:co-chaperonin GroES (HSP10)
MAHEEDPAKLLMNKIDVGGIEVFHNQVLLAIYMRPEKTASGLYLTKAHVDEDRYQSKIGLLLAAGPMAFKDPDGVWFQGLEFKVGDWLLFRPSDGYNVTVSKEPCRLLIDTNIKGRVSHPDLIY